MIGFVLFVLGMLALFAYMYWLADRVDKEPETYYEEEEQWQSDSNYRMY